MKAYCFDIPDTTPPFRWHHPDCPLVHVTKVFFRDQHVPQTWSFNVFSSSWSEGLISSWEYDSILGLLLVTIWYKKDFSSGVVELWHNPKLWSCGMTRTEGLLGIKPIERGAELWDEERRQLVTLCEHLCTASHLWNDSHAWALQLRRPKHLSPFLFLKPVQ